MTKRQVAVSDIHLATSLEADRNTAQSKLAVLIFLLLVAALVPVRMYDRPIFEALNGMHSPYTDRVWFAMTSLGDGLVLGIILGAFLIKSPRVTALGLTLLVLSTIALHLIKWLYPTPRPAAILESVHVVGPLLRSGAFPSGHAASVTAAGLAIIAYGSSSAVRLAVGALVVFMAASRIFVGAHWPSDIIGGMALSAGLLALILSYPWPRWEPRIPAGPRFASTTFRWIFRIEAAAALFTLFVYSAGYSQNTAVTAAAALCVLGVLLYGWVRRDRPPSATG